LSTNIHSPSTVRTVKKPSTAQKTSYCFDNGAQALREVNFMYFFDIFTSSITFLSTNIHLPSTVIKRIVKKPPSTPQEATNCFENGAQT
jgi:hypothetical protein